MTWPAALLTVTGALVGAYFGPDVWFLAFEPSFEGVWIGIWVGSAAGAFLILLVTRRGRSPQTGAWQLLLSLVALSFVAGFSRSLQHYGPWIDGGLLGTGLSVTLAALAARYLATRGGPVVASGWGRAGLAFGGLLVGGLVGYVAGAGFAGVMTDIVPCSGFECGVGTYLLFWLLAVPAVAALGVLVALLAARRSVWPAP